MNLMGAFWVVFLLTGAKDLRFCGFAASEPDWSSSPITKARDLFTEDKEPCSKDAFSSLVENRKDNFDGDLSKILSLGACTLGGFLMCFWLAIFELDYSSLIEKAKDPLAGD